jgi:hypothetical protein
MSESASYITTEGQSASLFWNKASIWGLRPDLYYCQTISRLLMWLLYSCLFHGRWLATALRATILKHSRDIYMSDTTSRFSTAGNYWINTAPQVGSTESGVLRVSPLSVKILEHYQTGHDIFTLYLSQFSIPRRLLIQHCINGGIRADNTLAT